MLTSWLTLTAFLMASAFPGRASIGRNAATVAPTCRVKGHLGAELTLDCGDGESEGLVRYWHTPFGDLQTFTSDLDPVFMDPDGGLVVPNASALHSGVYYCLLQHAEGTTLWSYELHVGHDDDENPENPRHDPCGTPRVRRDVGSEETREGEVSDGEFAAAVAASVLLTFAVGFSIGALTRTHVLRCLGAIRLWLPWQQRCQTATPVSGLEVTMTTQPPMYENQAFQPGWDNEESENCASAETTMSTAPAKPQRSFRRERQEEWEATAAPYLEGCGYGTEEEGEGGSRKEEEVEVGSVTEEEEEGCDGEEEGSQTDEDDRSESVEEVTQETRSEEEGSEKRKEEVETGSGDSETGSREQEDVRGGTSAAPGRRSRVIRLYQYDEDGQRYGHLQDSAPSEPGPAPMLKQRSLSLTRLSSIMAAASGPLDTRETGERAERAYFNIEI